MHDLTPHRYTSLLMSQVMCGRVVFPSRSRPLPPRRPSLPLVRHHLPLASLARRFSNWWFPLTFPPLSASPRSSHEFSVEFPLPSSPCRAAILTVFPSLWTLPRADALVVHPPRPVLHLPSYFVLKHISPRSSLLTLLPFIPPSLLPSVLPSPSCNKQQLCACILTCRCWTE